MTKIKWRLLRPILIVFLPFFVIALILLSLQHKHFSIQEKKGLLEDFITIQQETIQPFFSLDAENRSVLIKKINLPATFRLTLMNEQGQILNDSWEEAGIQSEIDRPEVKTALLGNHGEDIRYSPLREQTFLYKAIPVLNNEGLVGILRVGVSLKASQTFLRQQILLTLLFVFLFFATLFILYSLMAKKSEAQLLILKQKISQLSEKNRITIPPMPEKGLLDFYEVGRVLQEQMTILDKRIFNLRQERAQQEKFFSSMKDGVLIIAPDLHILKMNPAAKALLGTLIEDSSGRLLHEVVRVAKLQQIMEDIFKHKKTVDAELILDESSELFLHIHGTLMQNEQVEGSENILGALFVLSDVTSVKRLENLRKDFVANVSHELKTPLTSIKGFVETLLQTPQSDEQNKRFLEIISRHTQRLEALIEDLLTLSKIEQDTDRGKIALSIHFLLPLVQSAVTICQSKAQAKKISILVDVNENCMVKVHPSLIEQALINLIDNAIKYSSSETTIHVFSVEDEQGVTISVKDQGHGIAPQHLPRLFERFYRISESRGRHDGGTGLGLSIVKHVLQAHGSTVFVESSENKGSTFSFRLKKS